MAQESGSEQRCSAVPSFSQCQDFPIVIPPRSWASSISDFDKRIFGRDAWPRAVWEHELAQPDRRYLAVQGQRDAIRSLPPVLAIAGLRLAQEAELLTVAVAPELRRRGVAQKLVAQLLAWAHLGGAQLVFLEVRAGDAGAQALYQRFGFIPIARRRRYYSDDDALVMQLDLSVMDDRQTDSLPADASLAEASLADVTLVDTALVNASPADAPPADASLTLSISSVDALSARNVQCQHIQ